VREKSGHGYFTTKNTKGTKILKYAIFLGCTTPFHLKAYENSSRAVLEKLGVELVDIPEFNCCGYPLRNVDVEAFVLSSARNLALARKEDLNLMVLCKCGYGTFKKAAHMMNEDPSLREKINAILAEEGLEYDGSTKILHLLTVLHKEIGLESIKSKIERSYDELKIATHYGCHALRPSEVVEFDDPVAPSLFDELVNATGAQSIEWPNKLDCCGGPLKDINDKLSFDLTRKKIAGAKQTANSQVTPILYPQLLGLCLGLDGTMLGLNNGHTGGRTEGRTVGAELKGFLK